MRASNSGIEQTRPVLFVFGQVCIDSCDGLVDGYFVRACFPVFSLFVCVDGAREIQYDRARDSQLLYGFIVSVRLF
jgi:hypothetical protein